MILKLYAYTGILHFCLQSTGQSKSNGQALSNEKGKIPLPIVNQHKSWQWDWGKES